MKKKIKGVIKGLKKASKTHAAQAKTLETLKANNGKSIKVLKEESQKIIDNFPKKKKKRYIAQLAIITQAYQISAKK